MDLVEVWDGTKGKTHDVDPDQGQIQGFYFSFF